MKTVPFLTNPVLADAVIQTLASDLLTLAWIEYVYPIAETGINDEGNTYPYVYAEDGTSEYYALNPDDSVKAFSFFTNNGFQIGEPGYLNTYNFSLYVWCRLDKIQTNNNDFTMTLVNDCVIKLRENECFGLYVEMKDPFAEFTAFDYHENSMLMRKRSGFRIDFSMYGDNDICESEL
jgi:hypothetical protein